MPLPFALTFAAPDAAAATAFAGRLVLVLPASGDGTLPRGLARPLDKAMRGQLARYLASDAWAKVKPGEAADLACPAGIKAEALQLVKLDAKADPLMVRKAGGTIGARLGKTGALVIAEGVRAPAELALGLMLRAYDFAIHKTAPAEPRGDVTLMVTGPDRAEAAMAPLRARAEGVIATRDLVNEPANVLTTMEFADRLTGLRDLGVEVEVLDEEDLTRLGMRTLLAVGQGSESPSAVVVMRWQGGGDEAPLALVGKGVVFDSGGVSIKPAGGMEEMTMDMGGAGVVAGVMRTLALRQAKANVVGLVGLVENMLDGRAQRPGDVVRSMKGDTVEVINTDAEGRLVLADVLWYAQDRFAPRAVIDLATLTGAIIVALGHEFAGVFSNDDTLAGQVLAAAAAEGEGAWRMPMAEVFDAKLKSRIADMMNVGGRDGGAITAAQFLKRFIKEGTPWVHLDIAGVALVKSDGPTWPKGATGWGVATLDRLVRDQFEGK